jgi:hypothetical protein
MQSVEKGISLINPNLNHILEFGVCEGYSIKLIKDAVEQFWPNNSNLKIFGFDSFVGLPEDWTFDTGEQEVLLINKGGFDQGGKIPDIPDVKFYAGWFEDTIPQYLPIAEPMALIHVDCDLYSSTKLVFDTLYPYIVSGTILVFDEWTVPALGKTYEAQESQAFFEYVEQRNIKFEMVEFESADPHPHRKIIKIL